MTEHDITGRKYEDQLSFKIRVLRVRIENLEGFLKLTHYRPLRETQVQRLMKALRTHPSLHGCIAVNRTGKAGSERMVVVDGTHRLEAMKRLIVEDPTKVFYTVAHEYDHLTGEGVVSLFSEINSGVRVTALDTFLLRQDEFPIFAMLMADFPVTVTTSTGAVKNGIRVLNLLRAYLDRSTKGIAIHNKLLSISNEVLWKKLAVLGPVDHKYMKRFVVAFVEAFDSPGAGNAFSNMTGLVGIMRIYSANVDSGHLTQEEIVERWIQAKTDPNVLFSLNGVGYTATTRFVKEMIDAMNRGHRRKLAISPNVNGDIVDEDGPYSETHSRSKAKVMADA